MWVLQLTPILLQFVVQSHVLVYSPVSVPSISQCAYICTHQRIICPQIQLHAHWSVKMSFPCFYASWDQANPTMSPPPKHLTPKAIATGSHQWMAARTPACWDRQSWPPRKTWTSLAPPLHMWPQRTRSKSAYLGSHIHPGTTTSWCASQTVRKSWQTDQLTATYCTGARKDETIDNLINRLTASEGDLLVAISKDQQCRTGHKPPDDNQPDSLHSSRQGL